MEGDTSGDTLSYSDTALYVSFIRSTKNAAIRNLNFTEGSLSGFYVGGIVGYLYNGYVLNCTNANSLTGVYNTAGIVCYVCNEGAILGCVNLGRIVSSKTYANGNHASGIVGFNNNQYTLDIYVVGCINYGYVDGQYTAGISQNSSSWRIYG